MKQDQAALFTEIVLKVFRLNGCFLATGDKLVQPLELTSAKWQVMGAVALAGEPLTAPHIAEAMGITRQGVQKQVNALVASGIMVLQQNPDHKRSPRIALSEKGKQLYDQVDDLNSNWSQSMAEGLSNEALQVTLQTLEIIHSRLLKQQ